jgi:hypothetical protein
MGIKGQVILLAGGARSKSFALLARSRKGRIENPSYKQ